MCKQNDEKNKVFNEDVNSEAENELQNNSEENNAEEERRENPEELEKQISAVMDALDSLEKMVENLPEPTEEEKKKYRRQKLIKEIMIVIPLLLVVAILSVGIFGYVRTGSEIENISYTEALTKLSVDSGVEFEKILLAKNTQTVYLFEKVVQEDEEVEEKVYSTVIPSIDTFTEDLKEKSKYDDSNFEIVSTDLYAEKSSAWLTAALYLSKILFYIFIGIFIYKGIKSLINSIKIDSLTDSITGKKETPKPVNTSNYSFNDVAGIDNEKWEVEEVVQMLKNPERYKATGAKVPKGVLLVGEPGTGKTLIAKAIAGEAGVNFYSCSGSNFEEVFVGLGASKIRDLFEEARNNAPAIIFIDEIDSMAQKRFINHSHTEQTLNQLLSEMDGFNEIDNVIFIAATNNFEVLDPAITRPGRFDRIINIPLPDKKGRYEILLVHARNKTFKNDEKDDILKSLANKTSGMSGATLENILNEAAITAARDNRGYIAQEDVDEAFIKVIIGISKNGKETPEKTVELTAFHEAGHAIIGRIKCPERKILQVSIVPRGRAGGYTLFEDIEEETLLNKNDFYNQILINLGGRAAEKIKYNTVSVGASSDLENATRIAHDMIYTYAMSDSSQMVRLYGKEEYNEKLEEEMYLEMKAILDKAYKETIDILSTYSAVLRTLAEYLQKKSNLNTEEIEEIFKRFNL